MDDPHIFVARCHLEQGSENTVDNLARTMHAPLRLLRCFACFTLLHLLQGEAGEAG